MCDFIVERLDTLSYEPKESEVNGNTTPASPSSSLAENFSGSEEEVKLICLENFAAWEGVTPAQLSVQNISAGQSNLVFRVSRLQCESRALFPLQVLVRIYGPGVESVGVDHKTELICLGEAFKQGVSARCFSSFPGGRIEEFIESRTWTINDVRDENRAFALAEIVGRLHQATHHSLKDRPASLPIRLRDWAKSAKLACEDMSSTSPSSRKTKMAVALDVEQLCAVEVPWLIETLESLGSPRVLSHGDLNAGNILEADESCGNTGANIGSIYLVDFEFSGCDWRGFDIANFFCGTCNKLQCSAYPHFSIDPSAYPCLEMRREFCRRYLIANGMSVQGDEEIDSEVDKLVFEVEVFTLAAHMQWLLWSTTQAATSTIKYGFIEYALQRATQYFAVKETLLPLLAKKKE